MKLHCENVMNDLNYMSYEMGFPVLSNQVNEFPMLDENTSTAVCETNKDYLVENITNKESDRCNEVIEIIEHQESMVKNSKFIYSLL